MFVERERELEQVYGVVGRVGSVDLCIRLWMGKSAARVTGREARGWSAGLSGV